ncbi:MAG: RidA family protein [Chloroflexota bacterium]|nr:RidA family protein [Chloroflexota bacterium]
MSTPLQRLVELGLTLPPVAAPVANYLPYARTGNLLFIAGNVSRDVDGKTLPGKLGETMSVEEGYAAARSAGLYALAAMNDAAGSLDNVARIVRMLGMVNCTPDFGGQPQVINGASDLLGEVMGDAGRHSRAAVGMASLPAGAAVEIEVVCELG